MAFTPAVRARILLAIQQRAPQLGTCPVCHKGPWTLVDQFVPIALSSTPSSIELGGQILPSIALVCQTCGNTQILNLLVLGLQDLWASAPATAQVPAPLPTPTPAPAGDVATPVPEAEKT
jgi:hypothetical protein